MPRRNSSLRSTQKLYDCVTGYPTVMMRSAVIVIILTSMLNQSGSKPLDPDEKCVTGRNCAGTDLRSTVTICPAVYTVNSKITVMADLNPSFPITDGTLEMTAMISGQAFAQESFSGICKFFRLEKGENITCPFPANKRTPFRKTLDTSRIEILNGVREKISLIFKAKDTQDRQFLCNNVTITYDDTRDKPKYNI